MCWRWRSKVRLSKVMLVFGADKSCSGRWRESSEVK
jgi:hypothetical protein